jgi:hypothetical protein
VTLFSSSMTRVRRRTLAATAAAACLVLTAQGAPAQAARVAQAAPSAQAAPAQAAALSSADWAEASLPSSYYVGDTVSPVSCARGTRFCAAITEDSANLVNGDFIGQAALVSTNAGKSWHGYATLPAALMLNALSCVSASVCWAAGTNFQGKPGVAETTDGGQTWTDMSLASWATATWWPNSIECVSATNCWLMGQDEPQGLVAPALLETTDGGATWTQLSNLPAVTSADPNGTYQLNGMSCVSALSCVAVGGLGYGDGKSVVITTADGGANWTLSADPTLAKSNELFSVSCLPAATGTVHCAAAADALEAAGPVTLISRDGGATWGHRQIFDDTGWLNSISCGTVQHCWAAGAGTSVGLLGTQDGGTSWSSVNSDTTNQVGTVSCLNGQVCVAAIDDGIWVTQDDGGLGSTGSPTTGASTTGSPATRAAGTASHR